VSRSKNAVKAGFRWLGLDLRRYHPTVEPQTRMDRLRHAVFSRLGLELRRSRRRSRRSYKPWAIGAPVGRPQVRVVEFGWAKANKLFEFLDRKLYTGWHFDAANYRAPLELVSAHAWGLKGYGYSLVVDVASRLAEGRLQRLKVLDVGAGGSGLTRFLAEKLGAECWVIDDFGIESKDAETAGWYGAGLRDSLAEGNPNVRYVFGRLGGERHLDLKRNYFDLICSSSTLEHIPLVDMAAVFDHMFELLDETSGVMVHAIDLSQGQLRDWQYFLGRYFRLRGVAPATFVTHDLGEGPPRDPALLESAEVFYTLIRRSASYRFYHMGTLVLDVRCGDGEKGG
jgi:SAM-dependent methyltransferase